MCVCVCVYVRVCAHLHRSNILHRYTLADLPFCTLYSVGAITVISGKRAIGCPVPSDAHHDLVLPDIRELLTSGRKAAQSINLPNRSFVCDMVFCFR